MKILFLCTGNYYRSRFAELLFNHLAAEKNLDVRASSLGIAVERGFENIGPLSSHTISRLKALGIPPSDEWKREPRQAQFDDFIPFERIIALDEEEHRPIMRERFPEFENAVEYKHVHDLDQTAPEDAIPAIETIIRDLVNELSHNE